MTPLHLSAAFIERLGWVLVHSVWQFAFIALAAMVLERVMRRCSSAARYGALLLALGVMAAAPVITWLAIPDERTTAGASAAANEAAGQADVSRTPESATDSSPVLQLTPGLIAEPPTHPLKKSTAATRWKSPPRTFSSKIYPGNDRCPVGRINLLRAPRRGRDRASSPGGPLDGLGNRGVRARTCNATRVTSLMIQSITHDTASRGRNGLPGVEPTTPPFLLLPVRKPDPFA